MAEHPAVAEAVCFAVPDSKYGEEVHAAVVLNGAASAEEILAFCRDRLADFKVPKQLFITDVLPRTATGKFKKTALRERFVDAKV